MSVVTYRPSAGATATTMTHKAPSLVRWLDANNVGTTNPALRRHAAQQQLLMDIADEIDKASATPSFQGDTLGDDNMPRPSSEWVDAKAANFGRLATDLSQTATTSTQKQALSNFSMQFYDLAAEIRRLSVRSAEQRAHQETKRREDREAKARVNRASRLPMDTPTNGNTASVSNSVTNPGRINLLQSTAGVSQAVKRVSATSITTTNTQVQPSINAPACHIAGIAPALAHTSGCESSGNTAMACNPHAHNSLHATLQHSERNSVSHVAASSFSGPSASDATHVPADTQPGPNFPINVGASDTSVPVAAFMNRDTKDLLALGSQTSLDMQSRGEVIPNLVPSDDFDYTYGDGQFAAFGARSVNLTWPDHFEANVERYDNAARLGTGDDDNSADFSQVTDVTKIGSFPSSGLVSDEDVLDLTADTDSEEDSDWLNTDSEDEGVTRALATLPNPVMSSLSNSVVTQAPFSSFANGDAVGNIWYQQHTDLSSQEPHLFLPLASPTSYRSRFSFHPPPFLAGATTSTSAPRVLAIPPWRAPVVATQDDIRALSHWLATHVIGRLAYPEPARSEALGASSDEWDLGGIIDKAAKRKSGAVDFEPKGVLPGRPVTPVRPYRVHGKVPADPFKVLSVHGHGPTIKPHAQLVSMIAHLISEKEITAEVIVAAAWFVDALPVHEVDDDVNNNKLRELLRTSNAGESFGVERRLIMLGLLLADMSISDQHWSASDWGLASGVPKVKACAMERLALISLKHSISIQPKTWLDHCTNVYSSLAKLRFEPSLNWALLDVCHRMVQTARSIVEGDHINKNQWKKARSQLDFHAGVEAIRAHQIDTSAMPAEAVLEDRDDAWLDDVGRDAECAVAQLVDSDQENIRPAQMGDDDDEYEEFDGAGSFPQPTFDEEDEDEYDGPMFTDAATFHEAILPPQRLQEAAPTSFSAVALAQRLQVVATQQNASFVPVDSAIGEMSQTTGNTSSTFVNNNDFDDNASDCDSDFEEYDGAGRFPMPFAPRTRHQSMSASESDMSDASDFGILAGNNSSPCRAASVKSNDSLVHGFAGLTVTGRLHGGTMKRSVSNGSTASRYADGTLKQPRAVAPLVVTRAHVVSLETQAEHLALVPYHPATVPTRDQNEVITSLRKIRNEVAAGTLTNRPFPAPPVVANKAVPAHPVKPVVALPPPGARPPQLRREERILGRWTKNGAFGAHPLSEKTRSTVPSVSNLTHMGPSFFAPPGHGPRFGQASMARPVQPWTTATTWVPVAGPVPTQIPTKSHTQNQAPAPGLLELPPLSDIRSAASSGSGDRGGPRTPASLFRVLSWRNNVAAAGSERPPSVASSIATVPDALGCRMNPNVWEYRHALDEALAEEEEEHELTGYPPPCGRVDLPELQPGTVITLRARRSGMWSSWFEQDHHVTSNNGCAPQVTALS